MGWTFPRIALPREPCGSFFLQWNSPTTNNAAWTRWCPDCCWGAHAVEGIKNHKAASPDDIPGKLLKYEGEFIIHHLHQLVCLCWDAGCVPQQFKDSSLLTVYKRKSEKSICGNSRSISLLLSTAGKVLARINYASQAGILTLLNTCWLNRIVVLLWPFGSRHNICCPPAPEEVQGVTQRSIYMSHVLTSLLRHSIQCLDLCCGDSLRNLAAFLSSLPLLPLCKIACALLSFLGATHLKHLRYLSEASRDVSLPLFYSISFLTAVTQMFYQNNNAADVGVTINYRLDNYMYVGVYEREWVFVRL